MRRIKKSILTEAVRKKAIQKNAKIKLYLIMSSTSEVQRHWD